MSKSQHIAAWTYIESEDAQLFTSVLLPNNRDKFPTVVVRNQYVLDDEKEDGIVSRYRVVSNTAYMKESMLILPYNNGRIEE